MRICMELPYETYIRNMIILDFCSVQQPRFYIQNAEDNRNLISNSISRYPVPALRLQLSQTQLHWRLLHSFLRIRIS